MASAPLGMLCLDSVRSLLAAPAMKRASLGDDRYNTEEHGWARERCRQSRIYK